MSMELIYTSAPRGLKPGTRGFATVAMTQGMPPQLVERLESLSGYRQVFAPQDPQAGLNPVVQSHLRISVAGRNFHVLSRISAAGLDYSQRANKFAHHLVLDASELPPGGPAWLLAQPGVFATSWSGEPRLLASRRSPSGNTAAAICRHWQQLTGDAGWGGALTEAAIGKSKNPVTIIFRPGLDPLPLIAESLALIPPEQRWNITFSSYYTKLPPGVECNWRCVLEGSPESKGAAGLVIDLCRPLAAAQGGAYVTAARTGKTPIVKAAPARTPRVAHPDDLELELLLEPVESPRPRDEKRASPAAAAFVAQIESLPPMLPEGVSPVSPTSIPLRKPRLKQPARWPMIAAASTILLIIIGGGLALILANNKAGQLAAASEKNIASDKSASPQQSTVTSTTLQSPPAESASGKNGRAADKPTDKDPSTTQSTPSTTSSDRPKDGPAVAAAEKSTASPPQQDSTPPPDTTPPPAPPPNTVKPAGDASVAPTPGTPPSTTKIESSKSTSLKPGPKSDAIANSQTTNMDPLTEFRARPSRGIPEYRYGEQQSLDLGRIHDTDATDYTLSLIPPLPDPWHPSFTIEPLRITPDKNRSWACTFSAAGIQARIARFAIDREGSLTFAWEQSRNQFPIEVNSLSHFGLKVQAPPRAHNAFVDLPLERVRELKPLLLNDLYNTESIETGGALFDDAKALSLPAEVKLHFEILKPPVAAAIDGSTGAFTVKGPGKLSPEFSAKITSETYQLVTKYVGVTLDPTWKDVFPKLKSDKVIIKATKVAEKLRKLEAEKSKKAGEIADAEKKKESTERLKAELKGIETQIAEVTEFDKMMKSLSLEYRVYYLVGNDEVDIVTACTKAIRPVVK
jgi:GTPase-associated protein 1, N-terminal domain type 2/GTPase-associated protein 1, middle domain